MPDLATSIALVSERIAATAGTLDPRVSEDMAAIHKRYEELNVDMGFGEAAERARAEWIAGLLLEMLQGFET